MRVLSLAITLLRTVMCSSGDPLSTQKERGECEPASEMVWPKQVCRRQAALSVGQCYLPVQKFCSCVCLGGGGQMSVGRKAQGLRTLECTQEKSGCRLLKLGIKTDAALPARGPWDCIFPAACEERSLIQQSIWKAKQSTLERERNCWRSRPHLLLTRK